MTEGYEIPLSREIRAYMMVVNEFYDEIFSPDRCINVTRITIDVLKHFGIQAKPLSVHFWAFNQKWYDRVQAGIPEPKTEEELQAWVAEGASSLGIDTKAKNPDKYPGHVVTIAQERLIDAACGQFNRPEYDVHIPGILVSDLRPGFLAGKSGITLVGEEQGVRTYVMYKARPDDREFIKAEGFKRHMDNERIVRATVNMMKKILSKLP